MHKICFTISLFHASTCFEHHVPIVEGKKLYYTASGIITPIGGDKTPLTLNIYAKWWWAVIFTLGNNSGTLCMGTAVAKWLRWCATIRKVAGSISAGFSRDKFTFTFTVLSHYVNAISGHSSHSSQCLILTNVKYEKKYVAVPNDVCTASRREITLSIVAHLAVSCWTYSTVHVVPVTERRKVKQMKDILI